VGLNHQAVFVALYVFLSSEELTFVWRGLINLGSGVQHVSYKFNPFGISVRVEFPVTVPFSSQFPSIGTTSGSTIAKGALVTSVRIGRFAARMEFEL
jgi:hypothetical protein